MAADSRSDAVPGHFMARPRTTSIPARRSPKRLAGGAAIRCPGRGCAAVDPGGAPNGRTVRLGLGARTFVQVAGTRRSLDTCLGVLRRDGTVVVALGRGGIEFTLSSVRSDLVFAQWPQRELATPHRFGWLQIGVQ